MNTLGIDPGTGKLGWAIVKKENGQEKLIKYGCIETKAKTNLGIRLAYIYDSVHHLIKKYKPSSVAIEELFFAKNSKTAMSVGAARGVVILVCQQNSLPIFDYSPLKVKLNITGYGSATKKQVQYMLTQILKIKKAPKSDDAADAIAIALTHINTNKLLQ